MKIKSKNCKNVRTVVFNELRSDAKWGSRSLVENDPLWDYDKFIGEITDWSFEKMLEGLDFDYNGEGCAIAA